MIVVVGEVLGDVEGSPDTIGEALGSSEGQAVGCLDGKRVGKAVVGVGDGGKVQISSSSSCASVPESVSNSVSMTRPRTAGGLVASFGGKRHWSEF